MNPRRTPLPSRLARCIVMPMKARVIAVVCTVWLAMVIACAGHASQSAYVQPAQSASSVASVASATPCEHARALADRVATLMEQGKLHRTLAVIERANALCPETETHPPKPTA